MHNASVKMLDLAVINVGDGAISDGIEPGLVFKMLGCQLVPRKSSRDGGAGI
jgi:hypothetical protein